MMMMSLRLLSTLSSRVQMARLVNTSMRSMSSLPPDFYSRPIHPAYLKLKEQQKAYQVDNGLRIHERHGLFHNFLFRVVQVVTVGLLINTLIFFKRAANKEF